MHWVRISSPVDVEIRKRWTMRDRKMSEEDIQALLDRYAKSASPAIRDEIVLQYANLVESVARRFACTAEPVEDLVQEGFIGLINSIDRYDQSKGVKFSTYATHFIIGQMKHYLRDKGKIIKEPAWLQELSQRVAKTMEGLFQELNRQATEKEIADIMQMPEKTIAELLAMREVFKVSSLDSERDASNGPCEAEKVADDSLVCYQIPTEDRLVLESAMDGLKDIEQRVIYYHYYRGLNQTEIARKLNISCNYVSHIIRNGTKKLRKILTTEEVRDAHMQRSLPSSHLRIEEMERLTVIDKSTGLYNGTYFLDRMDEEISKAFRSGSQLALVMMEVMLPPEIDPLVRELRMENIVYVVSHAVRNNVRKMDILSRCGKTTLGLLLPHTGEQYKVVCERLNKVISAIHTESGRRNQEIKPYLLYGASYYPYSADTRSDLVKIARNNLRDAINSDASRLLELTQAA